MRLSPGFTEFDAFDLPTGLADPLSAPSYPRAWRPRLSLSIVKVCSLARTGSHDAIAAGKVDSIGFFRKPVFLVGFGTRLSRFLPPSFASFWVKSEISSFTRLSDGC